jgi:methylxanthine N1-demethylase
VPLVPGTSIANELDVAGEARLYRAMRWFWHPVMYASELTGAPRGAVLLGEAVVLVRLAGEVRCFADLCVHRGTALSLGWVEGGELRCAYHGWAYGPDGVCTKIPARFGDSIPRRARLRRYRVAEASGLIWVCLEEPRFPLPEFPQGADASYRIVELEPYDWETGAARRIENYVDFAHFAWVHDGVLGDRNNPEVPDHDVWRDGHRLRFGEAFRHTPHGVAEYGEVARSRERGGLPDRTGTILADKGYDLFMPYTVLLDQRLPGDRHYLLFFSCCPVGPRATRCFTQIGRNYDLDAGHDAKFIEFNRLIVGQDRPIVESQRPEELPVDLSGELHIRGADRVSLEYRKWLIELMRQAPSGAGV